MARGVVRMASSMGWRRGSRIMRRAKADVHADVAPDEVARTGNRARMNWLETTQQPEHFACPSPRPDRPAR